MLQAQIFGVGGLGCEIYDPLLFSLSFRESWSLIVDNDDCIFVYMYVV